MINKVILVGRLGQDPESKDLATGPLANLSLATSKKYKNKEGKQEEKTTWHKVVLFGKLASLASNYLKKGSRVYVEGEIQVRDWQDKDGNKRQSTEILGNHLTFLDSKPQGSEAKEESLFD